jgi:hypothetical protein
VWRLAHDIRGEGAAVLLRLWYALGWPYDVYASNGAVAPYGVSCFPVHVTEMYY